MLTIEFSAAPAMVRQVRKLVATVARIEGASELEAHFIEMAVGEVLVLGRSASGNGALGSVTVSVELRGGRFIVSVAGHSDVPRQGGMPAEPDDDYAIGWGLYIIAQVLDEVEVRTPVKRGQTPELRLMKRLG